MRYRTFALAAAALVLVSASANAQQPAAKLEIGKWSGIVTPPDGNVVPVIYDVTYAADTLRITINADSHGTFPVYEATFDGAKLSFKFRPGPEVVCVLDKKEVKYIGSCTDEGGGVALIEMSPPKKEGQ
jgi:hypothetical protein